MKLLINIGGTKTEALHWDGGPVASPEVAATKDFANSEALISQFLTNEHNIDALLLAVAGPVSNGRARLTNGRLHFDETALKQRFNLPTCVLANDAVAGAWSLYDPTGARQGSHLFACVGTGLGGALLTQGAQSVVIPLEPGRLGTELITDMFGDALSPEALARKTELEHVLSGTGLGRVADEIASHAGVAPRYGTSKAVFEAARSGDAIAHNITDRFWRLLAAFCAEMTLFFPDLKSIQLSGSVILHNLDALENGPFTDRYKEILSGYDDYPALPIRPFSANLAELRGLANLARVRGMASD
ncbi:MAG: ROK family protein [Arenibacterium sp.]